MTKTRDIQAALDYNAKAIENAEILVSHNIREAKDEAKAVLQILKTIRSTLQSHAPAHDAVDLEDLKRELLDKYIQHSCGNCDQCSYEAVSWVIDHLAPRLARSVPVGYALVPIEPTEDMVENGIAEYALNQKTWKVEDIWEAMISAAPQQKKEER